MDLSCHVRSAAALRFIELVRKESSNDIYSESYTCARTDALCAIGVSMLVPFPVARTTAKPLWASRFE
jgi:hypothetical protein